MANIKSSKKDIRRIKTRHEQNVQKRSRLRTYYKKIVQALAEGKQEDAQKAFVLYTRYLDRAGRTNLIHRRQADRKKSRVALLMNRSKAS